MGLPSTVVATSYGSGDIQGKKVKLCGRAAGEGTVSSGIYVAVEVITGYDPNGKGTVTHWLYVTPYPASSVIGVLRAGKEVKS